MAALNNIQTIPNKWGNWADTVHFSGDLIHPRNVEEVVDCVKKYRHITVVASGHSFVYPSKLSASPEDNIAIISLRANMNNILSINNSESVVEIEGGMTLAELAVALENHGLALENSPSLLQVSAVGCFATGTHGTGVTNCILTDMCESLTIVCGDGSVQTITDNALFVHLGLLGVVVSMSVRVVPFYSMQQKCFDHITISSFLPKAGLLLSAAYSVSIWVKFSQDEESVGDEVIAWLRNKRNEPEEIKSGKTMVVDGLFGHLRENAVPIGEAPDWPVHATVFGPWYDTLTFFRLGSELPVADSIQTEWFVEMCDLTSALACLASIPELSAVMAHGCEVRAVKADDFPLSPTNRRFLRSRSTSSTNSQNVDNSENELFAALHFTMDNVEVDEREITIRAASGHVGEPTKQAVLRIAEALSGFNARPHWAKLSPIISQREHVTSSSSTSSVESLWSSSYESIIRHWYSDETSMHFWRTVVEMDPHKKFRSDQFDAAVKACVAQDKELLTSPSDNILP